MKRFVSITARTSRVPMHVALPVAIAMSAAMSTPTPSTAASVWQLNGPDGGPVEDVAASATSLYAATQAGVYRSLDEGRHWTPSGSGIPQGHPISRLAISPTDPNVLWALGNGVHWRSGDGGASWLRLDAQSLDGFGPVTFDDETDGRSLVALGARSVRHSSDSGASWQTYAIGSDPQGWVDAFAVDARHRRYYALANAQLLTAASGTGSWRALGGYSYTQTNLLPDGSGRGLIIGFWNTESYRLVRYDIPTRTYEEVLGLSSDGIVIADPIAPGRLWLQTGTYDGTTSWQLRESRDFGRTWDEPYASSDIRTIRADRLVPDRLYGIGPRGFALSDDAGRHWETRTRGIPLALVNAIALHPHDPMQFLAGTQLGEVWLGASEGQWSGPASGLPGTPILSIAFAPSAPAIAFATSASGLYRSDDGGRHWRAIASSGLPAEGGTIDGLIVAATDPSLLTARTQGDGLYWSSDGGATWRMGASQIVRIAASPSGQRVYALQRPWPNTRWSRLLRADRHGAAFERVDEVTLTMALAVNPHADNVILALSNETGADLSYATRLSSDGGATWHERDRLFLTTQRTVRLHFDGCDSRTVYATTSGSTFARSHDLGMTWTYETLPLSGGTLHELSTACHRHRSHVTVHGGSRGVLVREPETVDAIWRWGYDGD